MTTTRQTLLQRCRYATPIDSPPDNPIPVGQPTSDPQITLSPQTPTALETTGFQWFIGGPQANYDVQVWKRDPASTVWAILVPTATYAAFEWQTVACNASELFFQLTVEDLIARIFLEETHL